jgi:hypothetical protein
MFENPQVSDFTKIRSVKAEQSFSMKTDRHNERNSRCSQFCDRT